MAAHRILVRHVIGFVVITGLIVASLLLSRQANSAVVAAVIAFGLSSVGAMLVVVLYRMARRDVAVERNLGRLSDYGERLSIYDKESGLYADWYFGLRLDKEIARSRRYRQPFALLLIENNDGNLGEAVKQLVFRALDDTLRDTDIVAHLTDKRFAVLLTNTDARGALVATARIEKGSLPAPSTSAWRSIPTTASMHSHY